MLALYIHVPFCERKCGYCGFYSTQYHADLADRYLEALEVEFHMRRPELEGRSIRTLYIGGGTPSLLAIDQLARLFQLIRSCCTVDEHAETSCEVNPNSASPKVLDRLKQHGVNRLSIGVQSFDPAVLAVLGRMHTAQQAVETCRIAQGFGFRSVGIDLIYGIPGQSLAQWKDTVEKACALRPDHISLYSLSIDEGSRLAEEVRAGQRLLPDDDLAATMYDEAIVRLRSAGYLHYEISNMALPSHECLHNQHYWDRGEYLGFGPSAWSFRGGQRSSNVADVGEYITCLRSGRTPVNYQETIREEQAAAEALMLGLRRSAGIDLADYSRRYGAALVENILLRAKALDVRDLIEVADGSLRLTSRGMLLSNTVLGTLLV